MLTMKEWMELVDYKITEGSDYCWQCYGSNAYQLDSWNGEHDGYSFCILFDTKTQAVYEVQAHDYLHQRAYRMVNEDFRKKMKKEAKRRNVDKDMAWELDDGTPLEYIDLEVDDDFIQKCLAIKEGEDYDTCVSVPLDLPDELLMFAFKAAHEENMTFNDWMNRMLRNFIDQVDAGEFTKEDAQKWKVHNKEVWPFAEEEKE